MAEHVNIAQSGGNVAKAARNKLETKLARSVISSFFQSPRLLGRQEPEERD